MELTTRKLGKRPPRHDPRTLQLENYIIPSKLPAPPAAENWGAAVPTDGWPMMKNDTVGDCTCAAAGHLIEDWTANATNGKDTVVLSDGDIVAAYSAITGYDPATGANDTGAVEIDVLNYWRKTGIGGHTILAYVAMEPGNHQHVMDAVYLFGGCYIGLALPISAQNQAVWSVPPGGRGGDGAPGSWGGHAVPVVAYDSRGLTCVTWGMLKRMTWQFWDTYCDEAYAVLSQDWLESAGKAPSGLDLPALQADLEQVAGTPLHLPLRFGGHRRPRSNGKARARAR